MSRIEQRHAAGVPHGTYDIFYYTAEPGGYVIREPGYEVNVHHGILARIAVREDKIAVANCRSQSGGLTVFGSRAAQAAWNAACIAPEEN